MFSIPLPKDPDERKSLFEWEGKKNFYAYLREYCNNNDILFGDTALILESYNAADVFQNDRVHLNDYGNKIVGEEIIKYLIPSLLKDMNQ